MAGYSLWRMMGAVFEACGTLQLYYFFGLHGECPGVMYHCRGLYLLLHKARLFQSRSQQPRWSRPGTICDPTALAYHI